MAQQLQDPEFRAGWEASAVGRALGLWLVGYRAEHQLAFEELAARLGIDLDRAADLEAGDEDPPAAALLWLSRSLGVPITLRIERGLPGGPAEIMVVDATVALAA